MTDPAAPAAMGGLGPEIRSGSSATAATEPSLDTPLHIGQSARVADSARSVLYDLLQMAILEIRGAVGGDGGVDEETRRFVFALSYLVHNWPPALRDAATEADYEQLLRQFWQARGWPEGAGHWMRERLEFLQYDVTLLD